MSGKIPRGEALLRRMSGASPTRCLTSPATSTPSATHNSLYKTSKTAPFGAVFLIFSAIVITVFYCNNDVLLEKLSDIQQPLSQLHVGTIVPDINDFSVLTPHFCTFSALLFQQLRFPHIALLGKLYRFSRKKSTFQRNTVVFPIGVW